MAIGNERNQTCKIYLMRRYGRFHGFDRNALDSLRQIVENEDEEGE